MVYSAYPGMGRVCQWAAVCLLVAVWITGAPVRGQDDTGSPRGQEVQFRNDGLTFGGTLLLPPGEGPHPALVMVHGAGPGPRARVRREADAFVQQGIAVLVYDKRTDGYSQFERSYSLLADDAIAAVESMRGHPEIDPDAVGLWGLSEGAWVVPLAAARSADVAFIVLVAATGVPPAQQHAWSLETQLRRQGVSGSLLRAVPRTGMRLLVGTGMFAEANHDPVTPLENVQQPALALWGELDRIEPAAESAQIVQAALERGGHRGYTLHFFPNANHDVYVSQDGYSDEGRLAPGYAETVGMWVHAVAQGEVPGPHVDPLPSQAFVSQPLAPLAWWESDWVQLGALLLPAFAFVAYLGSAGVQWLRRRRAPTAPPAQRQMHRWAVWLSLAGLVALGGFVGYFGYLLMTEARDVGPVVTGRALPWLTLQLLALGVAVSTLALAVTGWKARGQITGWEGVRFGISLAGGLVFALWAVYWGLLVP